MNVDLQEGREKWIRPAAQGMNTAAAHNHNKLRHRFRCLFADRRSNLMQKITLGSQWLSVALLTCLPSAD